VEPENGQSIVGRFCESCTQLTRIALNNATGDYLDLFGSDFMDVADSLTNLYLDGARFHCRARLYTYNWEEKSSNGDMSLHMLMYCNCLERLDIKSATWGTFLPEESHGPQPISQGAIIKLVRHMPTLRWLRSDLTAENVALLQQERPDVTFVMD
jgi:hypothetical protein